MKKISTNKVANCTLSLKPDPRTNKVTNEYPLAVCFNLVEEGKQKRYYHHVGEYVSFDYFISVCNCTSSRSPLMAKKKEWEKLLENYRERLVRISSNHLQLTINLIKSCIGTSQVSGNEHSFLQVWKDVINSRRAAGHVATADSYKCALNSFLLIMGDVPGFSINKHIIAKWSYGMKNGIIQNGKIVGKIADATRGIYLRSCRVIWHECLRQGFLTEVEYPFSNKDISLVSIPQGKRRQQSYLNVAEMTKLYQVFIEKRYPELWLDEYKIKAHYSLGLFLAQYLCNGFNLADAARLRYNRTYWAEGGRAFEFQRKKTSERSSDNSNVVVPIIQPLQKVLDEIAAKPTKRGYVFPWVFNGATDETERRRITLQENCNVTGRVRKVCKDVLGWDKLVSGTWARHSFATNLKLAGVEEQYIAESMGHSHGNDVTAGYQDAYPLEIRFRNNEKLLDLKPKGKEKPDLDTLTTDEMREMLRKLLG